MKTIGILLILIWGIGCHQSPENGEYSASSGGLVEDAICTSEQPFIQLHPENTVHFGLHPSVRASMHTEATCLSGLVCQAQARVYGKQGPLPITLGWRDQNDMAERLGVRNPRCDDDPEDEFDALCIMGFRALYGYRAIPPESGTLVNPACGKCLCKTQL